MNKFLITWSGWLVALALFVNFVVLPMIETSTQPIEVEFTEFQSRIANYPTYQDCSGVPDYSSTITDSRYGYSDAVVLKDGCKLVFQNNYSVSTIFLYPATQVTGPETPRFTVDHYQDCEGLDANGVFVAQPGCKVWFSEYRWIIDTTMYPH